MGKALEFVAFDIESTGFSVDDTITCAGFALPLGDRLFCRAAKSTTHPDGETLQVELRERTDRHVVVSVHNSEAALLTAVGEFVGERLRDDDVLIVAYNGEVFKGGFDLPFLRTRLARTDVDWPFAELPYADLMPVLTDRFNTCVPAEQADGELEPRERRDLETVYEVLVGGDLGEMDPFADSEDAVQAFDVGDLEQLCLHNLADIARTQALGKLAQAYCSKSDFSLKSLTPTAQEFDDGGAPDRPP